MNTPVYVCEEKKLRKNLEILRSVKDKSGAKIFLALKGFALSGVMNIVDEYLDGACTSGLFEAKFAKKFLKGEICTYSPAFKENEIDEIAALSNHLIFNSLNQLEKFKNKAKGDIGLRINPQISFSPTDNYNPCFKQSRLGVQLNELKNANLENLDGLHFHALCEQDSYSLKLVLDKFIKDFSWLIKGKKWINFGGGHHITRKNYDLNLLIDLIKNFQDKFGVQVYLEPGEAVGWETGYLLASVIDIHNGVAILDICAEAHMPDTILMPYRPEIENEGGEFEYLLGGNSCLAGDIIGLAAGNAIYKFKEPLKIGQKIKFKDQLHYSIVKNTTFNGVKLPDIALIKENGDEIYIRKFGYDEYERRN